MRTPGHSGHSFLRASLLLASGLLLAATLSAQVRPDQQDVSPAVRQAISTGATKFKIPGIAVAVIDRGQLAGIITLGVRDKDSKAPVTTTTVFEAGSLGEPLYAYAVFDFAASGRFNPGMPLPSYAPLPYVRSMDPLANSDATESLYDPQFNQINALRVMGHTSGMPDWARGTHLILQSAPGEKWSYSNEGYLYLQSVMAKVTAESFDALLLQTVFGPARMGHSSFTWNGNFAGQMAVGYDRSGAAMAAQHYEKPAAGTTLYTTIEDYARFVTFLLASAPAQQAHESAASSMLIPSSAINDSFDWGLGVGLEKIGGDVYFFNRGTGPSFQSFVMASRKTGKGIVILTNSGNGLDAVPDIVTAVLGGTHPIFKSSFLHSQ